MAAEMPLEFVEFVDANTLPEDMWQLVFSKLPLALRSLPRLVSKAWQSMYDNSPYLYISIKNWPNGAVTLSQVVRPAQLRLDITNCFDPTALRLLAECTPKLERLHAADITLRIHADKRQRLTVLQSLLPAMGPSLQHFTLQGLYTDFGHWAGTQTRRIAKEVAVSVSHLPNLRELHLCQLPFDISDASLLAPLTGSLQRLRLVRCWLRANWREGDTPKGLYLTPPARARQPMHDTDSDGDDAFDDGDTDGESGFVSGAEDLGDGDGGGGNAMDIDDVDAPRAQRAVPRGPAVTVAALRPLAASLEHLEVSQCLCSRSFLDGVDALPRLRTLSVTFCKLESVPRSIGTLSALTLLALSHNRISELPAEVGRLSELRELQLSHCRLTSLPRAEIAGLPNLRKLNVRGNRGLSAPAAGNDAGPSRQPLDLSWLLQLPSQAEVHMDAPPQPVTRRDLALARLCGVFR